MHCDIFKRFNSCAELSNAGDEVCEGDEVYDKGDEVRNKGDKVHFFVYALVYFVQVNLCRDDFTY